MTKPLHRALVFAPVALITAYLLGMLVLLFFVDIPRKPEDIAMLERAASPYVTQIDLIVGGLVALGAGWLAGRPLQGRDATAAGLMTGLLIVLIELLIVYLTGNAGKLDVALTAASYADKLAAATLGGFLAGRGGPLAENDEPEQVLLDKE